MEYRKIKFIKRELGNEVSEHYGYFHKWTSERETGNHYFPETYGLVEDEKGNMDTIVCKDIQFLEKPLTIISTEDMKIGES